MHNVRAVLLCIVECASLFAVGPTLQAYVYMPIPPATSYGHRAEIWVSNSVLHARWNVVDCVVCLDTAQDVEKWNYTVSLKVVSAGDELVIKLFDQASGEIFTQQARQRQITHAGLWMS